MGNEKRKEKHPEKTTFLSEKQKYTEYTGLASEFRSWILTCALKEKTK